VRFTVWSLALTTGLALAAYAEGELPRSPSPEGARVYIISPQDGSSQQSPLTVRFGLTGMGVAPAGVEKPKTGHHHLLINTELPELSIPIPADEKHRHFGGGQTEVVIELSPGTHTLQLLLADRNHLPHEPPVYSKPITIEVVK
jgi:hypothetical protein